MVHLLNGLRAWFISKGHPKNSILSSHRSRILSSHRPHNRILSSHRSHNSILSSDRSGFSKPLKSIGKTILSVNWSVCSIPSHQIIVPDSFLVVVTGIQSCLVIVSGYSLVVVPTTASDLVIVPTIRSCLVIVPGSYLTILLPEKMQIPHRKMVSSHHRTMANVH